MSKEGSVNKQSQPKQPLDLKKIVRPVIKEDPHLKEIKLRLAQSSKRIQKVVSSFQKVHNELQDIKE